MSTGGRTMFQTARHILLTDGQPMYVGRWQFIQDADHISANLRPKTQIERYRGPQTIWVRGHKLALMGR